MTKLTEKQKRFITRNHRTKSVKQLAKQLGVDEKPVEEYVASLLPRVSKHRELVFKAILVALPFVFFLLLELGLRVAGYGPNLEILSTLQNDERYLVSNADIGRRYFFVKELRPATSYDAILKEKPDNGYRVFVLGGSSAAGFPYYHNGAFSRMIATRLEDALPDRHVEVFNLAMPAVNSYAVLDLAAELAPYEPDAFLVYAGHNEFYGALGVGSTEALGRFRGLVNFYLKLQHLKTFYLLRSGIGWLKGKLQSLQPGQRRNATLMERMVGNQRIALDSEAYRTAREIFKANLANLFEYANKHDIDLLVSDLVSNYRDQPPFESLRPADKPEWGRRLAEGRAAAEAGDFETALRHFDAAAAIDSGAAELHFERGQALLQLGHVDEARAALLRAKDLDALRFRASEDFNAAMREVAEEYHVPVVPMRERFEQAASDGLIGNNFMLEHLHANIDGYFLMAQIFFEEMVANEMLGAQLDLDDLPAAESYRDRLGVTPLDLEVADIRIRTLLNGWPFQDAFDPSIERNYNPQNKMQEVAISIIRDQESWETGHVELAEHYAKAGRLRESAREYAALVRGTPYNVSAHIRLGMAYLDMQRYSEAERAFLNSLSISETATANKWLGSIYTNAGQAEKGLPYLRRAHELNRQDPETRYNLAVAHARLGNFDNARWLCQALLEDYPEDRGIQKLWQKLAGR